MVELTSEKLDALNAEYDRLNALYKEMRAFRNSHSYTEYREKYGTGEYPEDYEISQKLLPDLDKQIEAELDRLEAEFDKTKTIDDDEDVPFLRIGHTYRIPSLPCDITKKGYLDVDLKELAYANSSARKFGWKPESFRKAFVMYRMDNVDYIDKYITRDMMDVFERLNPYMQNISWNQINPCKTEAERRASFIEYLNDVCPNWIMLDIRVLNDYLYDWFAKNRMNLGYDSFTVAISKRKIQTGFLKALVSTKKMFEFDVKRLNGANCITLKEASEIYPEFGKQTIHRKLLENGYVDGWIGNVRVLKLKPRFSQNGEC